MKNSVATLGFCGLYCSYFSSVVVTLDTSHNSEVSHKERHWQQHRKREREREREGVCVCVCERERKTVTRKPCWRVGNHTEVVLHNQQGSFTVTQLQMATICNGKMVTLKQGRHAGRGRKWIYCTAHGNETELTGIRLTDLPGTFQRISNNQWQLHGNSSDLNQKVWFASHNP